MKLGLKHGRGIPAAVTRALLRSRWSHAVLMHDGVLMESTALKGRHAKAGVRTYVPTPDELSEYVWRDVPDHLVAHALAVFADLEGQGYDFFSLLSFLPPLRVRDGKRQYCYELVTAMLGGPQGRIQTVETIVVHLLNETATTTNAGNHP